MEPENQEKILDKIINLSNKSKKDNFSPSQMADGLLSFLSDREKEVIKLRYGFDGNKPKTLDSIGKQMSLTRERVRQIENQAIKNILRHQNYESLIQTFRDFINEAVKGFGGLVSEEKMIQYILDLSQESETKQGLIKFLLKNFLTDVEPVKRSDIKNSLRHPDLSLDSVDELLDELRNLFEQQKKILKADELIDNFRNSDYYKKYLTEKPAWLIDESYKEDPEKLAKVIFSFLETSHKFSDSPFNQWGLSDWVEIAPKRINGKIYLALMHHQKPMHFSEVADLINKSWVDARDVKTATVHNELIADDRFVLLGRGIYGLKDWENKK